MEKKPLGVEELEAQTALELPDRELPLVTVVISNVLNNNTVSIDVRDVSVGAAICANIIASNAPLDCDVNVS